MQAEKEEVSPKGLVRALGDFYGRVQAGVSCTWKDRVCAGQYIAIADPVSRREENFSRVLTSFGAVYCGLLRTLQSQHNAATPAEAKRNEEALTDPLLEMAAARCTTVTCRALLGIANPNTPLQAVLRREGSQGGPQNADEAMQWVARAMGGAAPIDKRTKEQVTATIDAVTLMQRHAVGWRKREGAVQAMLPHLLSHLEAEVFADFVAWLPYWSRRGSMDSLRGFSSGLGANSSVHYGFALSLFERGWRGMADVPALDEGAEAEAAVDREVRKCLDSMWFVQMKDRDLLSSALMAAMLHGVAAAERAGSGSENPLEPSLALRALGLITRDRPSDPWTRVLPELSPGVDVLWWAARKAAAGGAEGQASAMQLMELAVSAEEVLRDEHRGPAAPARFEGCRKLAARFRELRESPLAGTRASSLGTWREPKEVVLSSAIALTARLLYELKHGPEAADAVASDALREIEKDLRDAWLGLRRLQAFTRNCFLIFVLENPEYYYCIPPVDGSASCTPAPPCGRSQCQTEGQGILQILKRNLAEDFEQVLGDPLRSPGALARAVAEERATGAPGCRCGPNDVWEQGPATGGRRVFCAEDCRPSPEDAHARSHREPLVDLVGWPTGEGGQPRRWHPWNDKDQLSALEALLLAGRPGSSRERNALRSACRQFDAVHARMAPRLNDEASRECALEISEDNFPWTCRAVSSRAGPQAKVREKTKKGHLPHTHPPGASGAAASSSAAELAEPAEARVDLVCFYLRNMALSGLISKGVLVPAHVAEVLQELASTQENKTQRCEAFIRTWHETQPYRQAIDAAKNFARAVAVPRSDVARARGFLSLVACEAYPLDELSQQARQCRMRTLSGVEQLGALDAGCSESFQPDHPYLRCATQRLDPGGKTPAGLANVSGNPARGRNMRCTPSGGTACGQGAIPSQMCATVTLGRKVDCHASPSWTRSHDGLFGELRRAAHLAPLPWGDSTIELGHPAVVTVQPWNCTPYFRSAAPGHSFSFQALEPMPEQPLDDVKSALASLVLNLALSTARGGSEEEPPLFLEFKRCGLCSARGAQSAESPATCKAKGRQRTRWVPWAETRGFRDLARAPNVHEARRLLDMAAFMDRSGLGFAAPSLQEVVVEEGGALRLRPLCVVLAPPDSSPTAARTVETFLRDRDVHPGGSPARPLEHLEALASRYLHGLEEASRHARTPAALLARVTLHAQRGGGLAEMTGVYWVSSYAASLQTGEVQKMANRSMLAETSVTNVMQRPRLILDVATYVPA